VPHRRAAPDNFGSVDLSPDRNPLPSRSLAVGVGHIATDRPSESNPSGPVAPFRSRAWGVGQEPDAFALVGGASLGRAEQTPFRIEPEVGKVGEDVR
jgi:hypothetical protein